MKSDIILLSMRRGDRVDEGACLESMCTVYRTQGSNPCLSASIVTIQLFPNIYLHNPVRLFV